MRVAILFFLAACVLATFGQRTVVDLWWDSAPGRINLGPITFGASSAFAVELQCYFSANPSSSTRSSILSLSSQQRTVTSYDFEIYFVGRQLRLRLGNSVVSSSLVVDNYIKWAYIAVNVVQDPATGVATPTLFVNGVDQSGTLSPSSFTTALTAGTRDNNFIGYNYYNSIVSNFHGRVDSVYLWNKVLPVATIQTRAALIGQDAAYEGSGLIVRYLFKETTGYKTVGERGDAGQESYPATLDYPRAVLTDGDNQGWTFCQGWGDPHWTSLYNGKFDTHHVEGFFSDVACLADNGQAAFTIQTWHMTGCCWGGNTVIRALNVRLGNSMFQWSGSQALANGLAGPWVYKELVTGVAPTSIPWVAFSPVVGSPVTLGSGLQIAVSDNSGNPAFSVIGAPFGKLDYIDYGNYGTLNMYINLGVCPRDGIASAVCNGGTEPVPSWIFDGGDPSVVPVPLSAGAPVAAPPPQSCPAALQAAGEQNCKRSFPAWATTQSFEYSACLSDVCLTGNPWTPPPACTSGVPCCNCASTGTCVVTDASTNATQCVCDSGYGGADCSQIMNLVALTLSTPTANYDGLPYTLAPHNLADAVAAVANPSAATIAAANPWAVKNSMLAYVATVSAVQNDGSVKHSQHLYVINDATSSTAGGYSHSVSFTYSGTALSGGVAVVGTGSTFTGGSASSPASATFNVQSTAPSGMVFANLPDDWCIGFQTSTGAPSQILVGSGNIRGQLDVIRVVNTDTGVATICGKQISNPCANHLNCGDCTADASCGWCRTTGTCRYGRPNGPSDGTLCTAWAFTFSDVTRRITQTYGYPVSPVDTTIVLASSAALSTERDKDLPIEINVDMGARFYSAWDVQILFPNSASANSADVSGLQVAFGDILRRLNANYANSAVSVATYSSRATATAAAESNGDNGVFRLIFTLSAPSPAQQDILQAAVNGISLNSNALPAQRHLSLAIARAAATQQPGFRSGSRRLLIIFADAVDISQQSADTAALTAAKDALLAYSVLPVFVAKSGVKAAYTDYVRNVLGFGLVIDYTSPSNIALLVDRALTDASGAIATLVDSTKMGYVDVRSGKLSGNHLDTLMVTGLGSQMRSRNTFPVYSNAVSVTNPVTQILAPGFGKATIEPVASDSPYTTGPSVRMIVGQVLDPFTTFPATLLYLSGKPADVLQSTAVTSAYVKSVSKGTLYQFDEQALLAGAAITSLTPISVDGSGYVAVTDIQSRVLFVPPDNDFTTVAGQYYADIVYQVADECSTSPDGHLYVYVDYANNKVPDTTHSGVQTNENAPLVLTFVGQDYRGHELKTVITKMPTNDAGRASLSGTLFAYSDSCFAQLTADFPDVPSSGCTELTVGSEIRGTFAQNGAGAGEILSTVKAIYVPAQYANSDGIPSVYITKPSLSYQMVQILNSNDVANSQLETSAVTFSIDIRPVNQKPSVGLNLAVSRTWLSWPTSFADVDASACFSDKASGCNYDQNLGVAYPDLPAPLPLYFSGADVDSSSLSVLITGITCANGAIVNSTATSTAIVVGQTLSFNANSWASLVKFLPTQDGAASPYCTIKYKVQDEVSTSDDEGTIVINIASVPLPPRSEDVRVFAPRLAVTPFQFFARSVNDKANDGSAITRKVVSMTVLSCSGDLASVLTIEGQTVDCAAATPLSLAVTDNSADVSTGTGLQHTFNGKWTPTAASAANGFTIKVKFTDDHSSPLSSLEYTISFAYRAINYPPEMAFIIPGGNTEYGQTSTNKASFRLSGQAGGGSIGYLARDPDSGLQGLVHADIVTTGDRTKFTVQMLGGEQAYIGVQVPGHVYFIDAPINVISDLIATLWVDISQTSKIQFNVSITISDNGLTGACSVDNANPCAKTASTLLIVNADSAAPVVAYGLAAGAGGAALAAAAAAAIAWRTLRTPPTETYNPWAMDDANEGAVSNPLFEERGNSGTNPMFEMAQK